jgi:hypothetical protein
MPGRSIGEHVLQFTKILDGTRGAPVIFLILSITDEKEMALSCPVLLRTALDNEQGVWESHYMIR